MKNVPSILLTATLATLPFLSPLKGEETVFTEDFSDASVGQPWNGFKEWKGSEVPRIRTIPEKGKWGWFMDEPPGPAMMEVKLPREYELEGHAYQLTFQIRGTTARSFQVTLSDAERNRLGLQLGMNDSDIYQIAAVMILPTDKRIFFTDGGYHSTEHAPEGYSNGELYAVSLNLNGTNEALEIGNIKVPARHGTLIVNGDARGAAPTFTITFELPPAFLRFSELHVNKASTTNARWAVGDFMLVEIKPQ